MSDCKVYVGDYGTKLLITLTECDGVTPVPLGTPVAQEIIFIKPTLADPNVNERVVKTSTLETDGADGKIYYIFENGFIDVAGKYKYEANVQLASGKWTSTSGDFKVVDPLAV